MALPNPLEAFVWGAGGAQLTPEQIARQREIASALMGTGVDTSPVGDWTQGLARVLNSAAGAYRNSRADKAEAANAATNSGIVQSLLGGGASGFPAAPTASGSSPASSGGSSASATPIDLSGDKETFVSSLMPAAMEASKRTGVDPRIIVAQAAQETGWGKHAPGNNYFGIKSHGQGGGQNLATTEYVNGQPVRVNDSFRGYASPADSVSGYADFLLQNPRYKPLMAAQGLDAQLQALGASGYATDPNYASSVGAIARGLPMPSAVAANDAMATGQPIPAAPVQVASNDPSIGMVTPATQADDGGLQVGGPAATTDRSSRVLSALMGQQSMTGGAPMPMQGGTQVAQAAPAPSGPDLSQIPVMAGGTAGALPPSQAQQGINPAIIEALSNPAASEQTRKIAGILLGQQIEAQQQANDPMRNLEMQIAQEKLNQLRNPTVGPTDTMRNLEWRAQQAGLVRGTPEYNQFMMTGGKGDGVTVNVGGDGAPGLGKLSSDYGYVLDPNTRQPVIDPNTGLPKAAPVPGSPADIAARQAATASSAADENKATSSDVITGAASKIRALSKEPGSTGLVGAGASYLPNSPAAELYRQVDVLKSNATIENLNAMRRESKTGGALGNVTEKEGAMLAAKSGALDPKSPYFQDQLDDYERTLLRIVHGKDAGDKIFDQTRAPKKITTPDGYTIEEVE